MNPRLKETLIGVAAACLLTVLVAVVLVTQFTSNDLGSSLLLLAYSFIAPVVAALIQPWLLLVFVLLAGLVFLQFKYVALRFMRYLVGAEVILWQLFGVWCMASFLFH